MKMFCDDNDPFTALHMQTRLCSENVALARIKNIFLQWLYRLQRKLWRFREWKVKNYFTLRVMRTCYQIRTVTSVSENTAKCRHSY